MQTRLMTPKQRVIEAASAIALMGGGIFLGACAADEVIEETATPSPSPIPDPLAVQAVVDTSTLPGGVLLLEERGYPNFQISSFDFATEALRAEFSVPYGGFVYDVDASADGRFAIMSYSPPGAEGEYGYDRGGLYRIELGGDGSATPLLIPSEAGEYAHLPEIAAGGDFAYFVGQGGRFDTLSEGQALCRLDLTSNEIDASLPNASEPSAAHHSEALAWIHIDPDSGLRSLLVSDTWGGAPRELVNAFAFNDIGLPHFSSDDGWIYFLVILEEQYAEATPWNWLTHLGEAQAHGNHNSPAVWYRVPTAGGDAEALTQTPLSTYDGTSSGALLGYAGAQGLYLTDMNAGMPGEATLTLESRAIRSVDWLP